jgi:hypothetical protein
VQRQEHYKQAPEKAFTKRMRDGYIKEDAGQEQKAEESEAGDGARSDAS